MNKILLAIIGFFMAMGMAFAAVDLNTADEKELDSIKGVGSVKAKAIVEERKKNGPFKSLEDVQARVKGIGPATVATWKKDGSANVGGGSGAPKAEAKADMKAEKKSDAKAEKKADDKKAAEKKDAPKADAKADVKADTKAAAKKDEKKDMPKADAKAETKSEKK